MYSVFGQKPQKFKSSPKVYLVIFLYYRSSHTIIPHLKCHLIFLYDYITERERRYSNRTTSPPCRSSRISWQKKPPGRKSLWKFPVVRDLCIFWRHFGVNVSFLFHLLFSKVNLVIIFFSLRLVWFSAKDQHNHSKKLCVCELIFVIEKCKVTKSNFHRQFSIQRIFLKRIFIWKTISREENWFFVTIFW